MKKLLQLHFAFNGPFGQEMSDGLKDLAESINNEPGFIWKVWTENKEAKEAGGIYLFESEEKPPKFVKPSSKEPNPLGGEKKEQANAALRSVFGRGGNN